MPLNSISPIDGRYRKTTEPLAKYFSEQALMKYRLVVEGETELVQRVLDVVQPILAAVVDEAGA